MISTVLCDPSSSCETPATARPGSIIIFITDRKEHWSCDVEETSTWSSDSRNAGKPAFATVEIAAKKINIRLNSLIQARRRALPDSRDFSLPTSRSQHRFRQEQTKTPSKTTENTDEIVEETLGLDAHCSSPSSPFQPFPRRSRVGGPAPIHGTRQQAVKSTTPARNMRPHQETEKEKPVQNCACTVVTKSAQRRRTGREEEGANVPTHVLKQHSCAVHGSPGSGT